MSSHHRHALHLTTPHTYMTSQTAPGMDPRSRRPRRAGHGLHRARSGYAAHRARHRPQRSVRNRRARRIAAPRTWHGERKKRGRLPSLAAGSVLRGDEVRRGRQRRSVHPSRGCRRRRGRVSQGSVGGDTTPEIAGCPPCRSCRSSPRCRQPPRTAGVHSCCWTAHRRPEAVGVDVDVDVGVDVDVDVGIRGPALGCGEGGLA